MRGRVGKSPTIAVAIALAPAAFTAGALAAAPPPSPTIDPFYRAPAHLKRYAPGTVLRWRPVTVKLAVVPLNGTLANAFQLLYRTTDATGHPVANVTTVLVPRLPPPPSGRQLLSVNDAEDSVDPNCAPSYQLGVGELGATPNSNLAIEATLAATQLALGREVVIPDAEGPQSEYIVTGMEGHATLDSIRAVERFAPAGLAGARTKVGLIGYSGGAHVTASADELAPSYAPELNIVAAAAGGVPVANQETVHYLDGSLGAGVVMATAIALNRAYPALQLYSHLNAAGRAFAAKVSTGCASSVFAAPFAHFSQWTNVPNVFALPSVSRIIAANALGHHVPTAPTFVYNGIHDELIWIKPLDELVARYCRAGARIDYYRDPLGLEHIQGTANFIALALPYLTARFAGQRVPDTCRP
ncbi:MAG: lipase family protein [Solirubrobacteraceae bacterium]